jgi:hypothetical protein
MLGFKDSAQPTSLIAAALGDNARTRGMPGLGNEMRPGRAKFQ